MSHGEHPTDASAMVRVATDDDLEAIVELTRARRSALATWSPTWWAKADGADELHPLWLQHLTSIDAVLVIGSADEPVVGCAVVNDQGSQHFVDDIAAADGWARDVVEALVGATADRRRALTCLPTKDATMIEAFQTAGASLASSYWIASTAGVEPIPSPPFRSTDAPRPPHTFGGRAFDPAAPGALAFTTESGSMVGSPSITAPPVYDPGGTVTVADLVTGTDLAATLRTGLGIVTGRGDVLLTVVCGAGDDDLAAALGDVGFQRTVEVYAFPES